MSELTDVEINTRLARIAGLDPNGVTADDGSVGYRKDLNGGSLLCFFDALTDWNQLMPLLDGYNVTLLNSDGTHRCRLHSKGWDRHHGTGFGRTRQHAIALAIIAAHEFTESTTPAGRCVRCGADALRMLECDDSECLIPRAAHEEDSP